MDSYTSERDVFHKKSKLKNTLTKNNTLLEDPIRNGYLLCLLGSKLYSEPLDGVTKYPSTIRQCKQNLAIAFNLFRNYSDDYPYELLYKEEEILKGCPNTIWQFIEALMEAWKELYSEDPRLQSYANFEK